MKLLVIYNPQAGSGRAGKLLQQIKAYLVEKGFKAEIRLTDYARHATEIAQSVDLKPYDAVIASGGDGTLFEVLNGYQLNAAVKKPPMGLIPNGTGNAFIKELGLEKSAWKAAIDVLANRKIKQLDLGRFKTQTETYYFLNVVGLGLIPQIAEAAIPLKKLGNNAYTLATLFKLLNLKSQKIYLEIDGQRIEREGIFVEVANSSYTGTTFHIAPKAKLDDGLLDIVLLNKLSRFKLLRLFTSIYDGSHINYPEVEYIQAKKVKIIETDPGKLAADGELLGRSPVEFDCLQQALAFFWK